MYQVQALCQVVLPTRQGPLEFSMVPGRQVVMEKMWGNQGSCLDLARWPLSHPTAYPAGQSHHGVPTFS